MSIPTPAWAIRKSIEKKKREAMDNPKWAPAVAIIQIRQADDRWEKRAAELLRSIVYKNLFDTDKEHIAWIKEELMKMHREENTIKRNNLVQEKDQ